MLSLCRRFKRFAPLAVAAALFAMPQLAPMARAQDAKPKAPQVLFVQSASAVAYKDGVLTLKDAAPLTVFFSDRPERLAGHIRNEQFAKLWSEGKNDFKSDPPNAALSTFAPQGRPTQAIVVLSNPRLDGKNILYNARLVKGNIPDQGAESTIFIDGWSAPCNSGEDDPSYSGYPCWAQNAFSPLGGR